MNVFHIVTEFVFESEARETIIYLRSDATVAVHMVLFLPVSPITPCLQYPRIMGVVVQKHLEGHSCPSLLCGSALLK